MWKVLPLRNPFNYRILKLFHWMPSYSLEINLRIYIRMKRDYRVRHLRWSYFCKKIYDILNNETLKTSIKCLVYFGLW